jgi:phosphohistidine phosphatase
MEIYVMRHGDAVDREDPAMKSDEMRPLTDLGKDESAQMARALRLLGVKPDAILTSPLVRARETAEIVASELGLGKPAISDELAPDGSTAGVLSDILNAGPPRQVLLSGHMPGVGRIVSYLTWNSSETIIPMRTAAICRVDLPDETPFPGYGDLRWLLPPRTAGRLIKR